MSDSKPTTGSPKKQQLSTEDLEAMKVKRVAFMKAQMESLQLEADYTRLCAEISENVYKDQVYKVKHAEMVIGNKPTPAPDAKPDKKTPQ